ncbi:hypothetical protein DFJ43DRAFT_526235 [Lentinula guzmanii]|uniref:Uncharacterized protein n=1 Tax=Lentinula guzmanii TaxID=2804957 RepID=A0AA38N5D0_9AGAR|nr:hypothetical protein DFJ43DRAFT_526235 [Lentinula guzmanii]
MDRDSQERQVGENALKTRKRKREQYDLPDNATTSGLMHSLPPAPSFPAPKSRRTKRQERVSSWSGNKAIHHQVFDDAAFDVDPLPLDPDTYSPISSLDASIPSVPMPGDLATLSVQTSSFPSSEWVNSMVKAAHPPDIQNLPSNPWNDFVDPNTSRSWLPDLKQPPTWPSRPFSSIPSAILSKKSLQIPLSARSSGSNAPATSSKKPPFTNTIGMPYAKDPEGKRGEFKISSNTVVESKPHITYPHSPDPSRSLIMDQLPKVSRTVQWLKTWTQDACGTQPVFLAIDSSSAKALVEFSTIDQAEKAWSSPKLGKGLSSLSPTALKGKQRVDLIKVWWYRSPSPELVFTRKELEEGEIEDDEYTVDGRKESKKEKRARLARMVKDEKQKELVNSLVKSRGHSNMPPSIGSSDSIVGHTYALNTKPPPPPAPLSSVINAPPLAPISFSIASHNDSFTQLEYHLPSTAAKPDIRDLDDRLSEGPLTAHHHPGRISTMDIGISPSSGKQNDEYDTESSFLAVPSPPLTSSPLLEENLLSARQSNVRRNSPILTAVHPVLHPNSPSSVIQTISQGSSAVKRSILARQKELKRRIALGKQEIEWKEASAGELSDTGMQLSVEQTSSHLSLTSPNSFHPPQPSFESRSEPQSDKQAMEVHLRRLVLASQKKKSSDSDLFPSVSETIIGHDKPPRIDSD